MNTWENNLLVTTYTDPKDVARIVDFDCVSQMLEERFFEYGDHVAVTDGEVTYTYQELDKAVGSLRAELLKQGIQSGDRVGVFYPNTADFVIATLAVITSGAIAVLLPFQLDEKTLFGCSMKYRLKAIISKEGVNEKLTFAYQTNPTLVKIESDKVPEGYAPYVYTDRDAGCVVIFTAGTTGTSKAALLSNKAVMAGIKNSCLGVSDVFQQRYFLMLPLTHVFGFIRNLLCSLYTDSTIYICRDNKNAFREIPVFNPTILVLVPALANMALELTKMLGTGILGNSLKNVICGAATVFPNLVVGYDKIGVKLSAGYGLTETSNLVSGNPRTLEKPTSVGLFYPGQEYKIKDGELLIKGDNILTEYLENPEDTQAAFEDGYFRTGDLVKFDEDGFIYIVGRIKEIIVLSTGEKVAPAEVEAKFGEVDFVKDCLVYEENDRLVLEVLPHNHVIQNLGDETKKASYIEALEKVNAELLNFQKVSKIVLRTEDFERTPSMKIKRPSQKA